MPNVETCTQGKDRLDYVLISSHIQHAITTCGYEPFNKQLFSKHHSYFVDFDEPQLFGNHLQRLAALPFEMFEGKM
jgi:hypothetical protein